MPPDVPPEAPPPAPASRPGLDALPAAFLEPPGARPAPPVHPAAGRLAAAAAALLSLTALPAIVLVLPDTTLNVVAAAAAGLGLDTGGQRALLRATGLSLPALLLAVPAAAVAARRFAARAVLLTGVLLLLAGVLAASLAGSVAVVGAVRAVQGAGAGIALPATLVIVWERRSGPLTAVWAGTLAAGLIAAMPVALRAVPLGGPDADWRRALAPVPAAAGAAAAATLLCLVLRAKGTPPLPALRRTERGQLALPLVPAAGFAFLAVLTTFQWSPGGQLAVAAVALVALLGLALAGSRDATAGSPNGCAIVMLTAGLLGYPVAGPLAGLLAAGARAEGGGAVPLAPFLAGGAAALAGALTAGLLPRDAARRAVLGGHALVVAAVVVALSADLTAAPLAALVLGLLGAGLGAALAAALRDAGIGAALFGLALCFPAVLTGQLLVLSLQVGRLQELRPGTVAEQVYGLSAGYRLWLISAGVIAVLLAGACARVTARRNGPAGKAAAGPRAG
ncbi:hypothetical protein [Actinomadura parmotrematis]|uniref:MFS transporter n=1 Tax=Actinomadura parmotrematis TaxID=2864039 RepID=A0ABS7FWW8_9ACTN|nr:hypothetical protein [Actinomadura parmotrematis]MBW8484077.1 hypothetical protein [Actinomadura parmotrematis]